jgi:putative ABC transport system permease protein
LALGIAANAAIFSVVNAVLWKPFAYRDPGRIVMFQNIFRRGLRSGSASPTEFNWWRERTDAFEDVSAYSFSAANLTGESSAGEAFAEQIPVMQVSADFFRLCGTPPLYGRTFTRADDLPGAPKVAVLAYSFWLRRFGGDPAAIGRRIKLNGDRYQIAGVARAGLERGQVAEQSLLSGDVEIEHPPDVYIPFQLDPHSAQHAHYFNVAGRLKPGITAAEANARLGASYRDYGRRWPDDYVPGAGFGVKPLREAIVEGVRNPLLILWAAVGFVLLIACANIANLALARAAERKREIAIRAALGAARARIIRQLLAESALLALPGGILGLAAGYAGIRALLRLSPGGMPRIGMGGSNVGLDWRVTAFTLGLAIATAILCGLVPALQVSRADLNAALKDGGYRGGARLRRNKTRPALAIAEMGFAVALSIGAALLVRSFIAVRRVDPGFRAKGVVTVRMLLSGPQFEKPQAVAHAIQESLRRIRALPDVEAASATCCVPLEDRAQRAFRIAGRPQGPDSLVIAGSTLVSSGYFETFGIPILRGRAFTEQDENGPPVAIVNQTLAKQVWADGDPLKDQIVSGEGPHLQIVGIAGDVRETALNRDPRPMLYTLSISPNGLLRNFPWVWAVRARVPPKSLASEIQKELRESSGGLPAANARTMEETISGSAARERFNAIVMTIFGCSALLLAAIGIYGIMAHSAAERTHELGVRLALGARPAQIRNMVIFQALRLAIAGVACGLAAAWGLTRFLAGLLFGVQPLDPWALIVAPAILISVALIAVWLPARRAAQVDPIHALRCE